MRTPRPTLNDLFRFSASFLLILLDFLFSASKKTDGAKPDVTGGLSCEVGGAEGALGSLRVERKRDFGMNHVMGIQPAGSY